ncbi:MAG: hypothetical protein ACE5JA_08390, partial [bacterium]
MDAVIGWDTSVYLDMPLFDSWINLLKGLEMTYELCRRDVPVLGLAKGNVPSQISFSVQALS